MKTSLLLLALCLTIHSYSQRHNIEHIISYNDVEQKLSVQSQITFKTDLYQDTLWLQIPSRSLEWKESYLNQQVADFQNIKIHYARRKKKGLINFSASKLNNTNVELCQDCEFAGIPIAESKADSSTLYLNYNLYLPITDFMGFGYDENTARIIDWLPRIPNYDSIWYKYPVNFFNDQFYPKDHFTVTLSCPIKYQAISNLKQIGESKIEGINQTWYFNGNSKNLQIFLLKGFSLMKLSSGQSVYMEEEYPLIYEQLDSANKRVSNFFKKELNRDLNDFESLVIFNKKVSNYQSDNLLSLTYPKKKFKLNYKLAQARANSLFKYTLNIDGFERPWFSQGLSDYYKYHFTTQEFPKEKWLFFGDNFLGRLFALDDFNYAYQSQFLYLFLARQGLDQAINQSSDSLSRLNYEAIRAKTYLITNHLRAFLGERNFKRGMDRFLTLNESTTNIHESDLNQAFSYYSPKPIDWYFTSLLHTADNYDYKILDLDHCSTVTTATIENNGVLQIPYSITGYKDGEEVLTEWFEGHLGKRSIQLYHEDYDKVVINAHSHGGEYSQRNNSYYNRFVFPKTEPLKFTFINSFENAKASQIFYSPILNYNAYDKILAGVKLSNESEFVQRKFEWEVQPEYSFGTNSLTGYGAVTYNQTLPKTHFFRQIRYGIYSQYYHYNQDLAFLRLSPGVNLRIRKPYPKSPLIQNIIIRGVSVYREKDESLTAEEQRFLANYTVFNARYRLENTTIFSPTIFKFDLEVGDKFSKLYSEIDRRWMLPNKRWLILRMFGGLFLDNSFLDEGIEDNFYSFGLSGTPDYLFDYLFFGRSDDSGIWSKQFFVTDGGFRSRTNTFADEWLLSANGVLPIYNVLGVFGDAAFVDGDFYWDYGIRVSLLTDFFEVYFPLENNNQSFIGQSNYAQNIRFVMDLDLGNIVNRLRRGFY